MCMYVYIYIYIWPGRTHALRTTKYETVGRAYSPWGTYARGASRSRRAVWVIAPSQSLR